MSRERQLRLFSTRPIRTGKKNRGRGKNKRRWRRMLRQIQPDCAFCGRRLPHSQVTLDHLLPKSRGGTRTRENLVVACFHCNQAKRDRDLIEWAADILAADGKTVDRITESGVMR